MKKQKQKTGLPVNPSVKPEGAEGTGQRPDGIYDGKRTGYEIRGGKVYPAPFYTRAMDQIMDREQGVNELVQAVANYAAAEHTRLAALQRQWWEELFEDLGMQGDWTYHDIERCLTPPEPPKGT